MTVCETGGLRWKQWPSVDALLDRGLMDCVRYYSRTDDGGRVSWSVAWVLVGRTFTTGWHRSRLDAAAEAAEQAIRARDQSRAT